MTIVDGSVDAQAIETDVLVLGAGPAGCCAALRLLQLGHRVTLLERAPPPRPHVGESLTPGVANIAALLGVGAQVGALAHARAPAFVAWESERLEVRDAAQGNTMVDRAAFDRLLFETVSARGGRCLAPARLERLDGEPGAWRASVTAPHGTMTVRARLVVDARGRQGGARSATAPAMLALWSDLEDGPRANLVEARPEGWIWGARRPDGRFRVMAFTDPRLVRASGPAHWLHAQLASSRLFAAAARVLRPEAVCACAATPGQDAASWQPGLIKTGDAAFSIDPLSSSGVEKAMRFALQSAVAAHTMLGDAKAESLARRFHDERLAEAVSMHAAWARRYYALAWPDDGHAFWRLRRAAPQPVHEAEPEAAAVTALPPGRIRLCERLAIVDHPCVVDDRVQLRRALVHPNLARPVAFLDGAEVAPLLDVLRATPWLRSAMEIWSATMPPATAARIAGWLCAHRLVREA